MLVQHLRAILLGPVTVTIIIPALIVTILGPAPVDLGPGLGYLALTVGALLIAGGVAMLAWTISLFAQEGEGTLSPQDPPRTLVVHEPYRHVRHPMFSAVLAIPRRRDDRNAVPEPPGLACRVRALRHHHGPSR